MLLRCVESRRIAPALLAGLLTYGVVRLVQKIYTAPPRLPEPSIPASSEDGPVAGWLKRTFFRHFYVLRRGESLMKLQSWCESFDYRPFTMKIFIRPHIVLSDPRDAEQVLLTQEAKFFKGAGYDLVRMIIGDGLLAVGHKKRHAAHRRILAPIFSAHNIRGMSNEVTRVHALRMLGDLFADLQRGGDGQVTVNLSDHVNRMALSAIGEAAFRASREESVTVRAAFESLTSLSKMNYFCPYFRTRSQREAEQIIATISDLLVEKNMSMRQPRSRLVVMDALIDELYDAFSPNDVVDHLVTFLFAGHDTTSHTLQFFLALLGSQPHVQEALAEELLREMPDTCTCPTVERLLEMEYLVAATREVLRLYPAAPILYRDAGEDVLLPDSGVVVPKGMTAVISIFSIHRNETIYGSDAHVFRPERWMGEEGAALRETCGRCGFIPFSCGRRNCIGQEFGYLEILITIALLVRHLRIELVGAFPETKYNITLTTKSPVFVRLQPRVGVDAREVHTTVRGIIDGPVRETDCSDHFIFPEHG